MVKHAEALNQSLDDEGNRRPYNPLFLSLRPLSICTWLHPCTYLGFSDPCLAEPEYYGGMELGLGLVGGMQSVRPK